MKNLIILVTLLFSVSALAKPKYLEGATVTVTLKNGKTYTYSSEEMAVVKRDNMKLPVVAQTLKAIKEKKIVPNKLNRIYITAGVGNSGRLETETDGSRYKTGIKRGEVFGVGIQRKINKGDYNVGLQIQNNGTTSLSVGQDF